MSTFNSTISLNQQEFDSLTRVDKVVWNNNSFTCLIPATTPPPTTTTTPPPSTTPTPCVYPDPPIYDPPKLEDYYNGEDIAPYDPYLPSRPAAYAQQKAARKEALEAAARPMSDSEMETYLNNRVNGHGIYGGGIVIEGANMVYVLYDKERDFTYKLIEYDSQYSFLWVAWEAASEAAAEACAGTTLPPTTSVQPTTTTQSPSTTPTPSSTTSIGPPGDPIITLSMADKVIEIGSHKTLTINLQALTVGSDYSLEYRDFIKTTVGTNTTVTDYRNDSSIVLDGEQPPMFFTATSAEMSFDIELHNPTGVKLFNRVYNFDGDLMRNIETCGKKKQTIVVRVGSRTASESIFMYFEKRTPTNFSITNVSTREIPRGIRPQTTLTYDLEIEGLADVGDQDDFFEIYTLMDQRRSGEGGNWSNVPILKTQIAGFEIEPAADPALGDKIIISFSKVYPQLTSNPSFGYSSNADPIMGKTKLLELLYTNDLDRIGGLSAFNLNNEKNSLIYQTLPIAISNSFSINATYDAASEYGGLKFNQPLIDVETKLFNKPSAASLFIDKTDVEEYALITNLGPTIDIQVDKTILPYTPGDNVATFTLTCSNLIVGKYYKLNYTMTANGAKHYSIPRDFSNKFNLIGNTGHAFTSHLGNYPTFGKPLTEFDFNMMGDFFTSGGTEYQPPRGFVATDTTQTFTFKIENKNGLIAFEKSKIKCTVGAIGIKAFIQPGFDFYRSWERFNGTVAGTSIGMVELSDAPMPDVNGNYLTQVGFACGEGSKNVGVKSLAISSGHIPGTKITEDYTITSKASLYEAADGSSVFPPGLPGPFSITDTVSFTDTDVSITLSASPPPSCHSPQNQYLAIMLSLTNIRDDNLVSSAPEPYLVKTKECCPGE